ncbi:MAG: YceI family protein [Thermomicrobium sp.]|nr:YceI family protein [Thermomicrobium sp.]
MTSRFGVLATILLTAATLLAACGGGVAATPTPVATPTATVAPSPTPTTAATPTVALAATETPSPGAPAGAATGDVVFRLVPEQSEARYRAREQLLGRSLPNDAVGRTNAVEGQIVFTADGAIDAARSKFTVDLTTLRSDESRRDNYIKQNTLEVDRYPNAEFQPTAESGLPWPLPQSGQLQFQLEGNLTVHGVTKPVTWDVQATIDGGRITGTATTQVTFQDFGMTPPRVPIVLSLEDTITLELDFTFEPVS